MTVERFDPRRATPEDLLAWATVFADGQGELSGSPVEAAALARRLASSERELWAARAGGEIVGVAELSPQPHDPRIGFLRLFVAPPARRHGAGSALLAAVTAAAPGRGCDRLQSTVLAGPPGEPFAHRTARVLLRLRRQRQDPADPETLRRCHQIAATPPAGYEFRQWSGPAPEPLAASLGTVLAHVLDAPGAALQMPGRAWDTAAVRAWESAMTTDGRRLLVGAAVHLRSETVTAATVTTVPAAGGPAADQHDTAVRPGHRRRGLARWIKAEQTMRLHRDFPLVRAVVTTVNEENRPMIAVNDAVGYRHDGERLLMESSRIV